MSDIDFMTAALTLLDAEAPTKGVISEADPTDLRRRSYTVPTLDGRKQVVRAMPVPDSLFGERLELTSIALRELPTDPGLMVALLALARNFRRARLCIWDTRSPQLTVAASFVPDEIHEGSGLRLLHALREVASIADSIENQVTGVDIE